MLQRARVYGRKSYQHCGLVSVDGQQREGDDGQTGSDYPIWATPRAPRRKQTITSVQRLTGWPCMLAGVIIYVAGCSYDGLE